MKDMANITMDQLLICGLFWSPLLRPVSSHVVHDCMYVINLLENIQKRSNVGTRTWLTIHTNTSVYMTLRYQTVRPALPAVHHNSNLANSETEWEQLCVCWPYLVLLEGSEPVHWASCRTWNLLPRLSIGILYWPCRMVTVQYQYQLAYCTGPVEW
jgi:hypothetical protein